MESETTAPEMRIVLIELPVLTPKLRWSLARPLSSRRLFGCGNTGGAYPHGQRASFDLVYDSQILQAERVERGIFFVEDGTLPPGSRGDRRRNGLIREIKGRERRPAGPAPLATVYFLIKDEPGEAIIKPENIRLWSRE